MIYQRVDGERSEPVPIHWLKRPLSLQEAETGISARQNAIRQVLWSNPRRPKRSGPSEWELNWQRFKSLLIPGDQLWYYESSFGPLSGEAGFAIVRNNKVVHSIITMVS